jgi:hypothetical protein
MQQVCLGCGGDLPAERAESPFCPHCGTPQLFLAIENQSVETGGEPAVAADGTASTGALPPPLPRQVEWKTAIRCAAAVAGIGSLLCLAAMRVDQLSPVSFVWIISASMITVGLYQRRLPTAWVDVRVGARIGVLVGLCLAIALGTAMAGWGVISRFGLHTMGSFDAALTAQITDGMVRSQHMLSTPPDPRMAALDQTPEFHAGFVLAWGAISAAMLLLISTIGGAFAGLLRARRRRVA